MPFILLKTTAGTIGCGLGPLTTCLLLFDSGTVRLIGENGKRSGRVQLYHNGIWANVVIGLDLDPIMAHMNIMDVVCQQLGFPRALLPSNVFEFGISWHDGPYEEMHIYVRSCSGEESLLNECDWSEFIVNDTDSDPPLLTVGCDGES